MDLHPERSPDKTVLAGWAALSGVILGLAYRPSPVGSWPLGLICMVPLLLVLRRASARSALFLGWIAGFSATAIGFSWLVSAIASFGSFRAITAAAAAVPFWIWHGGRTAVFAGCAVRSARNGWHPWVGTVAAFAASEALYPVVLPWHLAGAVHDAPILLQVADLGGPILVGVIVLCASLLASELICPSTAARPPAEALAFAGVFVACALAYGAFCLSKSYENGAPAGHGARLTVGIVQGNVDPLEKQRNPAGTLRRQLWLTRRVVAEKPVDVVIWSETSTGYSVDEHLLDRWTREVVAPNVFVPMIFGTGVIGDGGRMYNAAIATLANGTLAGRYDKRRLFPVGEYALGGGLLPDLASKAANFSEGRGVSALRVLGHPVAVTICYEGLWPGHFGDIVRADNAELLVNLTNDVRFGDTGEPWGHFLSTKLRAIEQRRYLVRVANSGISAVVDPAGRVTVETGLFREETLAADVFFMSGRTVYSRLGDAPWYMLSAACLFMTLVRRRRPMRDAPASLAMPPTQTDTRA